VNELAHGQIWWADLPGEKIRPVLILTRGWVAQRLTRVLVAPVTSRARGIPSEVSVGMSEGLTQPSVVNLDNVQLIEVRRLLEVLGGMDSRRWPEVCAAMAHVIAC
jgi:mRNA interferase MazF